MMKAIKILKPGTTLGDINEIQTYVEKKGYSVVRDFCGHGISNTFHEPPNILHYGKKNTGFKIYPGMTFTIEPMINAGKYDVKILNDGWTAVTKDKSLSAQFEHTVGITENGYEIFTESGKGYYKPPILIMIDRYSRKELKAIWSEENKYKIWLDIEIAAAQAMEKYKIIPKGVASTVKKKAKIKVKEFMKLRLK